MIQTIIAALLGVILAGAALAQDAQPRNGGIEGTIQGQIDAFLQDDLEGAFDFASPSIQGMFGTPEQFGAMVRQGYPMVWRPADVRFGDLRERGGYAFQEVFMTDAQGVTHLLEYRMIDSGGAWLIAGVRILEMPELSA